jgi:predicted nucleic acid-binding protein
MARVLFDTDVLIDHLQDPARTLPIELDAAYSSISRAELYSSRSVNEAVVDDLLNNFEEIIVDRTVAEEAGRIRRESRLKLPDALIGASAMIASRMLVTRNVRDFRKVKGLRIRKGT